MLDTSDIQGCIRKVFEGSQEVGNTVGKVNALLTFILVNLGYA